MYSIFGFSKNILHKLLNLEPKVATGNGNLLREESDSLIQTH